MTLCSPGSSPSIELPGKPIRQGVQISYTIQHKAKAPLHSCAILLTIIFSSYQEREIGSERRREYSQFLSVRKHWQGLPSSLDNLIMFGLPGVNFNGKWMQPSLLCPPKSQLEDIASLPRSCMRVRVRL